MCFGDLACAAIRSPNSQFELLRHQVNHRRTAVYSDDAMLEFHFDFSRTCKSESFASPRIMAIFLPKQSLLTRPYGARYLTACFTGMQVVIFSRPFLVPSEAGTRASRSISERGESISTALLSSLAHSIVQNESSLSKHRIGKNTKAKAKKQNSTPLVDSLVQRAREVDGPLIIVSGSHDYLVSVYRA